MTDLVKHSGQVFTPDYLVSLILDEAGYRGDAVLQKHCIDNSCGDGAFLCEIVKRYVGAYQSAHASLDGIEDELAEYIHGIELEDTAFECCAENIKAVLTKFGLQSSSIDLLHANTLETQKYDGKMDFVVGNPPYVRVHNLEGSFAAVKTFSFANGGMTDLYLVFFEIGFRMLKTGGKLCYITPSSWLNSVAGTYMRKYILQNRNLLSVIDLGHFQAFQATTYTLISLFQKGVSNNEFAYYDFCPETLGKKFVSDIPFSRVCINGYFYLADNDVLEDLRNILTNGATKHVSVKNGFATLADKVFIGEDFPFQEYLILVIKASTGKWYKAFYPYDKNGKPIEKEAIFSNKSVAQYLDAHKDELLKNTTEESNPLWYLYGRTQALKDVCAEKLSINTTIKDVKSLKINRVPSGSGVYSGLYILSAVPLDTISEIIKTEDFIGYVASLKKYKSGGYYTYNSKDLEQYLNYKLSQLQEDGKLSQSISTPISPMRSFSMITRSLSRKYITRSCRCE